MKISISWIRLQRSFRMLSMMIYTFKTCKLSQYLNFVLIILSTWPFKKSFLKGVFLSIFVIFRAHFGWKIAKIWPKIFFVDFELNYIILWKFITFLLFFSKKASWYPKNDTYPEYHPQSTIFVGKDFGHILLTPEKP